jgi:hypothetical protein
LYLIVTDSEYKNRPQDTLISEFRSKNEELIIQGLTLTHYSSGDESEAIFYTKENLEAWKMTPGALDWLIRQTK